MNFIFTVIGKIVVILLFFCIVVCLIEEICDYTVDILKHNSDERKARRRLKKIIKLSGKLWFSDRNVPYGIKLVGCEIYKKSSETLDKYFPKKNKKNKAGGKK